MTERTYRPLTRYSAKLCERALAIAEGRLERTYQGEYPSEAWATCAANVALLRAHMAAGWMTADAWKKAKSTIMRRSMRLSRNKLMLSRRPISKPCKM